MTEGTVAANAWVTLRKELDDRATAMIQRVTESHAELAAAIEAARSDENRTALDNLAVRVTNLADRVEALAQKLEGRK